jgi:hypothetical protein
VADNDADRPSPLPTAGASNPGKAPFAGLPSFDRVVRDDMDVGAGTDAGAAKGSEKVDTGAGVGAPNGSANVETGGCAATGAVVAAPNDPDALGTGA